MKQEELNKDFSGRLAYLTKQEDGDVYDTIRSTLRNIGLGGLAERCGLTRPELDELIVTTDPYRATALFRAGLLALTSS